MSQNQEINSNITNPQMRTYYVKNREKIIQDMKEYNDDCKDYLKAYREKRYQQNREELLKKSNEYKKAHAHEISERNKEKITCECGSVITRGAQTKHNRTVKHCDFNTTQK